MTQAVDIALTVVKRLVESYEMTQFTKANYLICCLRKVPFV